jgi:hypothetical protein
MRGLSCLAGYGCVPCRAVHEEVIKLDQDFGLAYSGQLRCSSSQVLVLRICSTYLPS